MTSIDFASLREALPKTPGILGKNEFFNSAVLLPLIKTDGYYSLLFEKRAEHIRQGGEICFPGGGYEEETDSNFKETAIRETEEELGIGREKIRIVGRLDTLIGPRNVTVDPFIGIVELNSIDDCTLDKEEVAKVFTVPLEFFMETEPEEYRVVSVHEHQFLNSKGEEESLIPIKNNGENEIDKSYSKSVRKVYVYKTEGEVIWGITARLIKELTDTLKRVPHSMSNALE